MDKDELEQKLENISIPPLPQLQHGQQLKLSILSARKSAKASLWLLLIPFLVFVTAFLRQWLNLSLPPDAWLEKYSLHWPQWLRILVFMLVLIIIPLLTVVLNILSITWFQYKRQQKVLNIAVRLRPVNLIIIITAGLVALLFTIVMITD